jgi:hypothetical protein
MGLTHRFALTRNKRGFPKTSVFGKASKNSEKSPWGLTPRVSAFTFFPVKNSSIPVVSQGFEWPMPW